VRLLGYSEARVPASLTHLSPTEAAILGATLDTLLPPEADRSNETIQGHVAWIDGFLVHTPEADRKQLSLLLYGIEHATLPLGPYVRRFTRLPYEARVRYLRGWQQSRIAHLRLGLKAIRALAFLAYYRTPAAMARIDYPGPMTQTPGTQQSRERYDGLYAPPEAPVERKRRTGS
jgi:hypothetical protein